MSSGEVVPTFTCLTMYLSPPHTSTCLGGTQEGGEEWGRCMTFSGTCGAGDAGIRGWGRVVHLARWSPAWGWVVGRGPPQRNQLLASRARGCGVVWFGVRKALLPIGNGRVVVLHKMQHGRAMCLNACCVFSFVSTPRLGVRLLAVLCGRMIRGGCCGDSVM